MPVNVRVEEEKGWKADENGRVGDVVVLSFVNSLTGKSLPLSKWAPKHSDIPVLVDLICRIYAIEIKNLKKVSNMRAGKILDLNKKSVGDEL